VSRRCMPPLKLPAPPPCGEILLVIVRRTERPSPQPVADLGMVSAVRSATYSTTVGTTKSPVRAPARWRGRSSASPPPSGPRGAHLHRHVSNRAGLRHLWNPGRQVPVRSGFQTDIGSRRPTHCSSDKFDHVDMDLVISVTRAVVLRASRRATRFRHRRVSWQRLPHLALWTSSWTAPLRPRRTDSRTARPADRLLHQVGESGAQKHAKALTDHLVHDRMRQPCAHASWPMTYVHIHGRAKKTGCHGVDRDPV